jgi:hypothetical protein
MGLIERAEEAYINANTPSKRQIDKLRRMQRRFEKDLAKRDRQHEKAAKRYAGMLGCDYKVVERKHFHGQYRKIVQLWDGGRRVLDCVLIYKKGALGTRWELYSLVDCYRCGPSDQLLGTRIYDLASLHMALINHTVSREECSVVD